MEQITQKRQLAAIMFTDIVGYTALMGADEDKAFALLKKNRRLQQPLIEKFNGKWLKEIGDGVLASFSTVSDAVYCAAAIQQACQKEEDLNLKIGIHLGEVVFEGEDVFGDGVNIASRLESIAPAGGIWVSESVSRNMQNKQGIESHFVREEQLKNVKDPVKVYAVTVTGEIPGSKMAARHRRSSKAVWLYTIAAVIVLSIAAFFVYRNYLSKDEDSIKKVAILPFKNTSNDPETDLFVNGIMRVVLDKLANIANLEVTAGQAVAPYADGNTPAKELGAALDVDYVLETSVQKTANNIKIAVKLVDIHSEQPIWVETYTKAWKNVLQLQSELSLDIAENLNTTLTAPEIRMIRADEDINPVAQDYLFKAWDFYTRGGFGEKQSIDWAIELTKKALAVDSTYTMAWMALGDLEIAKYFYGHDVTNEQKQRAKDAYDQALRLQPESFRVQLSQKNYLYRIEHNYPKALQITEKLVSQYPNKVFLKGQLGTIYRRTGDFEKAAQNFLELSKLKPTWPWVKFNYGQTMAILRNYKEAERVFHETIEIKPDFTDAYQGLAEVQIDLDGNLIRARETLNQPFLQQYWWLFYNLEIRARNFNKAIEIWQSAPDKGSVDQGELIPKSLGLALVYYMAGNDSAQVYFRASLPPLLAKVKETPDDWRLDASLGLAYAGLNEKQKALASVKHLEDAIISLNDALMGPIIEQKIIRIYIMNQEYHLALELIKAHLQKPVGTMYFGSFTINDLKLHPMYDPLRELPEFKAILANPKYQINVEDN
jgi:adenylate cyclase